MFDSTQTPILHYAERMKSGEARRAYSKPYVREVPREELTTILSRLANEGDDQAREILECLRADQKCTQEIKSHPQGPSVRRHC